VGGKVLLPIFVDDTLGLNRDAMTDVPPCQLAYFNCSATSNNDGNHKNLTKLT